MNKGQRTKDKGQIIWLLFALVIIFIYFFGLSIPLVGPDEPRYAQVAREMYLRGDWITPTLGGFDWFEKPALLYWLQIASYKIFGVSEFAARFGSALFGLGTILALWILGSLATENTENHREIEDGKTSSENSVSSVAKKDFANWLALIAASSIGLLAFSRGASFDIILTFPITAALVAFFIFDQSTKKSGFTFYLLTFTFYFLIGVALIAKGLVGIVFPFAIVAFYYLLSRKLPSKIFVFSLIWGTILSLLIASVWYLPMYQANGWKFVDEFIIQHHFQRYTSNKYLHPQPFWFFFLVLPLMTLPWLPFFLASIWEFIKLQSERFKVNNSEKLSTLDSQLSTFAFAWLLVPLVFFSLSGSKLPGYILPSLPAALILTAIYVFKFAEKSRTRRRALQILAFSTFALIFVILQFFTADFTKPETVKNMIETIDAKGFADKKIVNLFAVSHNLEFYAAGRLIRETDGKLKRYDDFSVLVRELENAPGKQILVAVSQEVVPSLIENSLSAKVEVLAENGETAIVSVKSPNF
ncbi:MAG: glycosyltransferase family 39 protein [Pyrinomonadaceae bacterium]|nr:glycosyltransferase family 39 protein [Pyrinomonadaceae bacterium]